MAIYRRQKTAPTESTPSTEVDVLTAAAAAPDLATQIQILERRLDTITQETTKRVLRLLAIAAPLLAVIVLTDGHPIAFMISLMIMAIAVATVGRVAGSAQGRLTQALQERLEALKIRQIEQEAGLSPPSTQNPADRRPPRGSIK